MSRQETWLRPAVLAACCYGMMAISFVGATHVFWAPSIMRNLGLNPAGAGVFLSCAFWGMAGALLLSGPLADRYGFRGLLVGGAVCQSLGLLVASAAATPALLYLGACLGSLGNGAILALATPVVFALYPHAKIRVGNFLLSFCSVGAVVVVGLGIVLFERAWAWQEAYRLIAVLVLPYGLALAFLPLPASCRAAGTPRRRVAEEMKERWRLLKRPPFVLALAGILPMAITVGGISVWVPSYVEQALDATRRAAGGGLIVFACATALGNWLNSALVRSLGPRRLSVAGGTVGAVALLTASRTTNPLVGVGCFALLAFGMAGFFPAIVAHCGDRFVDGRASMYSLLYATGNVGQATGTLMIGLLAAAWSLPSAMTAMAAGPLVALATLLALLPRRLLRGQTTNFT